MPILLVGALWTVVRSILWYLIQSAIAFASFETIGYIWEKIVDGLRDEMKTQGKLTEDEVDAVMEDETLKILTQLGVTALVFRSKVGSTLAKKVGLTTGSTGSQRTRSASSKTAGEKKLVGVPLSTAKKTILLSFLGSLVASIPWLPSLVQQFGDQASFAPTKANDFYEKLFGKRPFPEPNPLESPGRFTPSEFTDYARGLEAAGLKGIEYGFPKGTFLYSRDELAKLIEMITGQEESKGNPATPAKLKVLLAPYLVGINKSSAPIPPSSSTSTTTPQKTTAPIVQPPKVQVFTGVVSQGVLGGGTVFQPRSSDMIDDVQELIDSAAVNLAGYLSALPSRVTYEIKIVNSITTKDGFTQRGTTTQIISGYYSNGQPKFRNVTNKFAVLYLYLLTDKGTRTKIATINIGPVNSVNFQVTSDDLNTVSTNLQKVVTTNKTSDITTIISDSPVPVETKKELPPPLPNYNLVPKEPGDTGMRFYKRDPNGDGKFTYTVVEWAGNVPYGLIPIEEEEYRRATNDTKDYTNSGYKFVNGVITRDYAVTPSYLAPGTAAPPMGLGYYSKPPAKKAATLSEYYNNQGQPLPTVQARSLLYEQYGLGSKNLYIGSAEQNIRLLDKLNGL